MAELVIRSALLRVREDFVGLLHFLELVRGLVVVRIAIRVKLHRQPAIGLLDVRLARRARHVEDLVVIALRHSGCGSVLLTWKRRGGRIPRGELSQ